MTYRTTHLISIIIIVFFAGSTIWWMHHSYEHDIAAEHYTEHIKDYPLLDPALPFYDKKDLVVNIEELREYLNSLPEQNEDWADMSIYFEVMSTGANVSVNNTLKLPPASLSKLPMAMIAMEKVERGEWSLETEFIVEDEDLSSSNDPSLSHNVGEKLSLGILIDRLLIYSDNTAYHMIVSELKDEELISIAEEVGLDDLFTMEGTISAKDYTRLFRALHSSTYLSEENSQHLLSHLAESKFDKFLRAGIPSHITFAHKWGIHEQQSVYADSGIVYLKNRPYMLAVMIKGKAGDNKMNQARAEELIREIGKRSYDFMSKK